MDNKKIIVLKSSRKRSLSEILVLTISHIFFTIIYIGGSILLANETREITYFIAIICGGILLTIMHYIFFSSIVIGIENGKLFLNREELWSHKIKATTLSDFIIDVYTFNDQPIPIHVHIWHKNKKICFYLNGTDMLYQLVIARGLSYNHYEIIKYDISGSWGHGKIECKEGHNYSYGGGKFMKSYNNGIEKLKINPKLYYFYPDFKVEKK